MEKNCIETPKILVDKVFAPNVGGGTGRVRVLALTTPQKPLPTVILNLFQNLTNS